MTIFDVILLTRTHVTCLRFLSGRDFEPPREPVNECHTANNINPAITLSFVRFILNHLITVSVEGLVNPPAAELATWRDIAGNLAPLPVGYTTCTGTGVSHPKGHAEFMQNLTCVEASSAASGTRVLLPHESPWFFTTRYNPLEFYAIWPGEEISLSSTPEMLETARNTVILGDAFAQNNAFCEAFPAAVRVGVNATVVIEQLTTLIRSLMPPNGYMVEAGGGYETAGTSIAVNEMLLQSHEEFIRFFPVFPAGQPASFSGLRAVGAFVVSAQRLANGSVVGVKITSEAGRNCTVLAPDGTAKVVVNAPRGIEIQTRHVTHANVNGLWCFATRAGTDYTVTFL